MNDKDRRQRQKTKTEDKDRRQRQKIRTKDKDQDKEQDKDRQRQRRRLNLIRSNLDSYHYSFHYSSNSFPFLPIHRIQVSIVTLTLSSIGNPSVRLSIFAVSSYSIRKLGWTPKTVTKLRRNFFFCSRAVAGNRRPVCRAFLLVGNQPKWQRPPRGAFLFTGN